MADVCMFFRLEVLQYSLISHDRSRLSSYLFVHTFLLFVISCAISSSHTLRYFLLEGPLGPSALSASIVVSLAISHVDVFVVISL